MTGPEQVFEFMSVHQSEFPIATIDRVLGVSPSGSCAWRSRPASAHATSDAALLRRIRTIHAASHGTYGAPRVDAELQADGTAVARKRVARLMRGFGLRGESRRCFPTTMQGEPSHTPTNDPVGRDFRAAGPNRLWVADITYVPTAAGFLFLAVVLHASSRQIVGWAIATDLRTRLPATATSSTFRCTYSAPGARRVLRTRSRECCYHSVLPIFSRYRETDAAGKQSAF